MHGVTFGSVLSMGAKTKHETPKGNPSIFHTTITQRREGGEGRFNSHEDHPEARRGAFPYQRPFQILHIPEGDGELIAFGEALEGGLCR